MDGPWRRAHGAEPERGNLGVAKAVRWGEDFLVPFWSFKKGLAVRAKAKFQLDTNAGYVLNVSVKKQDQADHNHHTTIDNLCEKS